MPLRGIAEDPRLMIPLTPDGQVSLHTYRDQQADPAALARVLEYPATEVSTNVLCGSDRARTARGRTRHPRRRGTPHLGPRLPQCAPDDAAAMLDHALGLVEQAEPATAVFRARVGMTALDLADECG
jgi:hypothetical protein